MLFVSRLRHLALGYHALRAAAPLAARPAPSATRFQRHLAMSSAPQHDPIKAVDPVSDPAPECSEKVKAEAATPAPGTDEQEKEALPPLSPEEFRQYNRLAEHMDLFVSCAPSFVLPCSSLVPPA